MNLNPFAMDIAAFSPSMEVAPSVKYRTSARKRKAVETYAVNDSQSADDSRGHASKRTKPTPGTLPGKVAPRKLQLPNRKSSTASKAKKTKVVDPPGTGQSKPPDKAKARSRKKAANDGEEKRLKKYSNSPLPHEYAISLYFVNNPVYSFKPKMPQSVQETLFRATTQRMFVVNRDRHANEDCPHGLLDCPKETVDLAGTTGNIYTVTIEHLPSCTCPNFIKGNSQCKHILYVLVKVLKAHDHLQYQAAFLTSELREIFDHAGPLPTETVSSEDKDGKRKSVDGECPICVEDLEANDEQIVWCQAACGNNLHKACFDQWAASKRGAPVTCPYCRTNWQDAIDTNELKHVSKNATVGRDGYVNIAQQLGISGKRDYSTYHPFWVRREHRAGRINDDEAEEHYYYD